MDQRSPSGFLLTKPGMKGLISKETLVRCRWGSETRKSGIKRVDKGQIITGLRTVPTNSKVFLPRFMTMQEM